ncbi:unnamed protein product, partial [Staurois parvus]
VHCVPRTQRITDHWKEPITSARSYDQLCPSQLITDDQCSPISATCQCPSMPPASATSMPHISAHLSCLSMPPLSASQCRLSVLPISAHQ